MYSLPVQISTSSCNTTYQIGKHRVLLWAIVSGEPALDFTCYGYSERYPIKDTRWMGNDYSKPGIPETGNWDSKNSCFIHQDPKNPQGPTFDILPNGVDTIYEFLDKNVPIKELREFRTESFPTVVVESKKRLHHKAEHYYFRLKIDVSNSRVNRVRYEGIGDYGGCGYLADIIDMPCIPQQWKDYDSLIESFGEVYRLETLTEDQFQKMLTMYRELAEA